MSFYPTLQKVAADVFSQFKQGTVIHVRMVAGVGPADDPGQPTIVETSIAATVSKAGGNRSGGKGQRFIEQGLAVVSDLVVSTGVTEGVNFEMSDMIKIDGTLYKIVGIVTTPASGVPVAYQIIVRR